MGWQDRDWAKFDAQELEELYGIRRRRRIGVREGVATAIVVSALGTLALGRMHLLRIASPASAVSTAYPQHVIYGIRGTDAANPNGPGGTSTACTAETFDATQGWQCQEWAVDVQGLPIAAPSPYRGSCAVAKVDQTAGMWLCVSATAPSQPTTTSITG